MIRSTALIAALLVCSSPVFALDIRVCRVEASERWSWPGPTIVLGIDPRFSRVFVTDKLVQTAN